jgi:hypothetical protein
MQHIRAIEVMDEVEEKSSQHQHIEECRYKQYLPEKPVI